MTIREQYVKLLHALQPVSSEADAEAREILAHVYSLPPGRLIMRFFDEAASHDEVARIVRERLTGRPLAYVLRSRDFYGADYYVDERVLIPRSDTESVAEAAIAAINENGVRRAADLCCGSGCIGITLLRETDVDCVVFADISPDALDVARMNAQTMAVSGRAQFACGDFLQAVPARQELIVCNPPYIAPDDYDSLEPQVRCHEPRLALVAKEQGMYFHRRLALDAGARLVRGGILIAETGDDQAGAAAQMLADAGFTDVRIGQDIAGRDRFVQGRNVRHAGED